MNEIQATLLTGFCGAILGGAIGVIGTYVGATRIAARDRLADAGRRMREAFYDELAALEVDGGRDLRAHTLLESAFKKHLIAVSEYMHILSMERRRTIAAAWVQYHCCQGKPEMHFLEQYNTVAGSTDQRDSNRRLAIERIRHLLSLTE